MLTYRVVRLDTKTGSTVEYLLPRRANVRRVFVDDRTSHEALWIGSNHGAFVAKIEPLDEIKAPPAGVPRGPGTAQAPRCIVCRDKPDVCWPLPCG